MANLPSFQFYPADWVKDANLRRCSKAEKGLWVDVICLMHESDVRGALVTGGRAWPADEIAEAVGGDKAENLRLLEALTLKGVSKVAPRVWPSTPDADPFRHLPEGAYYNARMVRDEHKRKLCSDAGKRGGNPTLKGADKGLPKGDWKGEDKGPSKRNPTPSSSSSSSDPRDRESAREAGPSPKEEWWDFLVNLFQLEILSQRDELTLYEQCGELRERRTTKDEFRERALRYREKHPEMPFTVNAVLNNWSSLKPAPVLAPARRQL